MNLFPSPLSLLVVVTLVDACKVITISTIQNTKHTFLANRNNRIKGLECMSGRCRARPSHGLDAGGHVINADAAPNVDSLTDSQVNCAIDMCVHFENVIFFLQNRQIAAIRAKIAAHECDSQSSSKPCTEQVNESIFVFWFDLNWIVMGFFCCYCCSLLLGVMLAIHTEKF